MPLLSAGKATDTGELVLPDVTLKHVAKPALSRVRIALPELASLKKALAMSQLQTKAAQRRVNALARSNLRLKAELASFAKEVARARHFAYHDELTGLPNRSLLLDRLSQAMVQAARQHKQVVVLFADLNGFKRVNDSLGHAAGDKLLRKVAERLLACIRGADTACRYGGDEFVIMLPEFDGSQSASGVVDKIRAQLAVPYAIGGDAIAVTASIGMAIYPDNADNCEGLIRHADCAMYASRAQGSSGRSVMPAPVLHASAWSATTS